MLNQDLELVLVFGLGDELYGLEVHHIQEIVESPVLHYIPRAPAHLVGAVNFHGNIIPVLDLAAVLGFAGNGTGARVIVLAPELGALALAVRFIQRIVPLDPDFLLPVRSTTPAQDFVRAVYNRQGEMVNLLDVKQLLAVLEKQT